MVDVFVTLHQPIEFNENGKLERRVVHAAGKLASVSADTDNHDGQVVSDFLCTAIPGTGEMRAQLEEDLVRPCRSLPRWWAQPDMAYWPITGTQPMLTSAEDYVSLVERENQPLSPISVGRDQQQRGDAQMSNKTQADESTGVPRFTGRRLSPTTPSPSIRPR